MTIHLSYKKVPDAVQMVFPLKKGIHTRPTYHLKRLAAPSQALPLS